MAHTSSVRGWGKLPMITGWPAGPSGYLMSGDGFRWREHSRRPVRL